MLKDYRLPPLNNQPPQRVVIFLHGLGDSGSGGLLSLGQVWQPHLPDCEFLCPDAPFAFDMAPPDFGGRQWFSLKTFDQAKMLQGTITAAPYLNDYIDHVMATRKLPADRIALVGFSQGTMMALYTAPRRNEPVACIVGYSGALIGGETLAIEKKSSPPILLVHGNRDDVVPFAAMGLAEQTLTKAGFSVTTVACPTAAHTIDDIGLREGLRFIKQAWGG
jgi:phospholipase/carboxylesterase